MRTSYFDGVNSMYALFHTYKSSYCFLHDRAPHFIRVCSFSVCWNILPIGSESTGDCCIDLDILNTKAAVERNRNLLIEILTYTFLVRLFLLFLHSLRFPLGQDVPMKYMMTDIWVHDIISQLHRQDGERLSVIVLRLRQFV